MDIKLEGDKLSPECVQQLLKQPQGPPQLHLQPGQHLQPVPPTSQPQQVPQPQPMMLTQQQAQQLQISQQQIQQQQVQQMQIQQQQLQMSQQQQQQLQPAQQQLQQLQPAQQQLQQLQPSQQQQQHQPQQLQPAQQQSQQIQQQQLQTIQLQQQPVPQPHQMAQQQQVVTSEQQVVQQLPTQLQQQVQFIHHNGQVHAVPLGTQIPPNAQIIGTGIATSDQPQPQQQPQPTIVTNGSSFPSNVVQPYQLHQAQYPGLSQIQQPTQGQQHQQQPQVTTVLPQQILSSMQQSVQQPPQPQQPQVSLASAIPQGGKVITVPGIPGHFVQTGPNSLIQVPPGYVFDQTNSVAVQVSQAGAGNSSVYATAPTSAGPQLQPVISMPNGLQQPQMVSTLPNGQMIVQAGPGQVANMIGGPGSNGPVPAGGQLLNAQAPGGVQIRPQTPQVRINK